MRPITWCRLWSQPIGLRLCHFLLTERLRRTRPCSYQKQCQCTCLRYRLAALNSRTHTSLSAVSLL